jgi:NUMOD4 motif./HNH endonuclease.
MKEVWLPLHDYETEYLISNKGKIKNFHTGYIKKIHLCNNGYPSISIYKNNVGKIMRVHVLVAKTFLGLPKEKQEVNHKNSIRTDNRASNLEWVTRKEICFIAQRWEEPHGAKK